MFRFLDFTELYEMIEDFSGQYPAYGNCLNGIAYNEFEDRLMVTGKMWPLIFEIKLNF